MLPPCYRQNQAIYADEARALAINKFRPQQIQAMDDILGPVVLEFNPRGPVGRK